MLLFFLFLSGALAQEALPIDILVDILLADEKYPIFFRIQYMEQRHCILKNLMAICRTVLSSFLMSFHRTQIWVW